MVLDGEGADEGEFVEECQQVSRLGSSDRTAQPGEPGNTLALLGFQQRVHARCEVCFKREVQQRVDVLVGPNAGDADQAFEDLESRRQDLPAAQLVNQSSHQGKRLVGEDSSGKQPVAQFVVEGPRQLDVAEVQAESREVLPASRVTTRIQFVAVRVEVELVREILEHFAWGLFMRTDTAAKMPENRELDGVAELVELESALTDQDQVVGAEQIVSGEGRFVQEWKARELVALGCREQGWPL